jgi:uncharacterized protein YbaP (TraB family)
MRIAALFAAMMLIAAPAATADEPATSPTPPIWRVSDGDSDIYLLAAIHVLPEGTQWRSPAVARAVDAAEKVWFEADDRSADAQARAGEIIAADGANPDGVTLTSMLETTDAMALAVIGGELGAPAGAFDRMRPWRAFLTLSIQTLITEGYDPAAGLAPAILAEARARGRDVRYLTSIDDQLGVFTGMTRDEELGALSFILRNWRRERANLPAVIDAWRAGDIAALDDLLNAPLRTTSPAAFQKMVVTQNEAFADRVQSLLAGRGAELVIIGAGNLVGENSAPALLAARGVEIERIAN